MNPHEMDPREMDQRWEALSYEFAQIGQDYQAEQLADPNWCARELARKGYSISLTMVTRDYIRRAMPGRPPPRSVSFPHWTYQLWGPRYPTRGAHNTFAVDTIAESAAMALFNICRLEHDDQR